MYLEKIRIQNLRVFVDATADFQYPRRPHGTGKRKVNLPNVNLILGNNGAGKSSLLRAIALGALGPLSEKFSPFMLVRRRHERKHKTASTTVTSEDRAHVECVFQASWQDAGRKKPDTKVDRLDWSYAVTRFGDEEFVQPKGKIDSADAEQLRWRPIHEKGSPAFLTVGYGATRRVDTDPNAATPGQKDRTMSVREQRVRSLFTEGYTLVQLGHWLPQLKGTNPGRHKQVCDLINRVLPEDIEFTGQADAVGEYQFQQAGAVVPFAALSDGCRAFLGWVADLLYHICFGCPSGVKLVDNCGIVLVDEIDLHLHPEWQRSVLPTLARTFPHLQFIVTSHSPIVVGTLQRENLWVCEPAHGGGSVLQQKGTAVHGLNADQILNTEYFGLESSRAPEKTRRLNRIASAVERKVPGQATAFLKSLVTAMEDEADPDTSIAVEERKSKKRIQRTKKKK